MAACYIIINGGVAYMLLEESGNWLPWSVYTNQISLNSRLFMAAGE